MGREIALSKGRKITAISARLLSCDELEQYDEVIPSEIIDGRTYDHFCYGCYGSIRTIPEGRAWIGNRPSVGVGAPFTNKVYPIIVFESQDDVFAGESFYVKEWKFYIISDTLAISAEPVRVNQNVRQNGIFAKSDFKVFMELWEQSLFDDDQPLLTGDAFEDLIWQKGGILDTTDVRVFEQGTETYIEIDEFGTLAKYIPAIGETDIVLPEGIEAIRNEAFVLNGNDKAQFKSIILPKTLRHIEIGTFMGIVDLEKIEVHPENLRFKAIDGVLFGCRPAYGDDFAIVAEDVKGKFEEDILICYPPAKSDFTEYTLPNNVMKLETGAFMDSILEVITLDFSLADERKFDRRAINNIRDYIFKNCKKLRLLRLINSKKLAFNGTHTFSGCNMDLTVMFDEEETSLTSVGLISVDKKTMYCVNIDGDELIIPDGVKRFKETPDGVIGGTMRITSVVFPDSFTSIKESFFTSNTARMEKLVLGRKTKKLREYTFGYCRRLKYVEARGLEVFQGFEGCTNLEKIVLGPNCCNLPKNVVIEAPAGSQTIENAKNESLEYIET